MQTSVFSETGVGTESMSVATDGSNVHSPTGPSAAPIALRSQDAAEFDYRPMTPLAPLALFIGLCSVGGLLSMGAMALPVAGVIVGVLCLIKVRRDRDAVSGGPLGIAGLVLSTLMLVAGSGYHAYVYATEVPEGHERLSFNWLASQAPIIFDGQIEFTPELKALDGQKIFIKGYMLITQERAGLTEFTLCKDTGDCCFGADPKLTDMVVVKMQDGRTVDLREMQLVNVAGTLRVKPVYGAGQLVRFYTLEATHFQ